MQMELLKLYATNISDADLLEIKRYLARFFVNKAVEEADKRAKLHAWIEGKMTKTLISIRFWIKIKVN